MRNKALILVSLLIASSSVLAEKDLAGEAGKQLLKDTSTSAAPKEAVKGVESTGQKLEDAKKLNETVKSAPEALNLNRAVTLVKQKPADNPAAAIVAPAGISQGPNSKFGTSVGVSLTAPHLPTAL